MPGATPRSSKSPCASVTADWPASSRVTRTFSSGAPVRASSTRPRTEGGCAGKIPNSATPKSQVTPNVQCPKLPRQEGEGPTRQGKIPREEGKLPRNPRKPPGKPGELAPSDFLA